MFFDDVAGNPAPPFRVALVVLGALPIGNLCAIQAGRSGADESSACPDDSGLQVA